MVVVGDKVVSLKGDWGVQRGEIGEVIAIRESGGFEVRWERNILVHHCDNIGKHTEVVVEVNEWEGNLALA